MKPKERMFSALNYEEPDIVPVAPHWWGVYKFEFYGRDPRWAWYALDGHQLAQIDIHFYESFKPDWFHLDEGVPRSGRDYKIEEVNGEFFLVHKSTGERYRIKANQSLEPVEKESALKKKKISFETKDDADIIVERSFPKCKDLIRRGQTDHVEEIVKRYGDDVLVAVNVGGPSGIIYAPGFTQGLVMLYRKPNIMKYLIRRAYEAHLEVAEAYATAGCQAWIISEDRIGADIIPPRLYEEFFFEPEKRYFGKIRELGMIPILYFCGNVMPLLKYIRDLGVDGLMIEESRKNFTIDIVNVKEALDGKVCVFGNLDTVNVLWKGNEDSIVKEVKKQLQAASGGGFVASNGSPIAPGTPVKNVKRFIESVREYGRYPLKT